MVFPKTHPFFDTIHTMASSFPSFMHEIQLWQKGYAVIGIDEVGRGCLAGPTYVAAVCFPPLLEKEQEKLLSLGINDSKKLSPSKREAIYEMLQTQQVLSATALSDVDTINQIGIVKAVEKAAYSAVEKLYKKMAQKDIFLLSDGFLFKGIDYIPSSQQQAIVKGDSISLSIASASIIAKVERDLYMQQLAPEYPHYAWEKNKGYGTKDHLQALKEHGRCIHHRDLFIRNVLKEN